MDRTSESLAGRRALVTGATGGIGAAVVRQLAAMKAREVVLIGGEAYLHPGFLDIVRALKRAGIRPSMTTGGLGITPDTDLLGQPDLVLD